MRRLLIHQLVHWNAAICLGLISTGARSLAAQVPVSPSNYHIIQRLHFDKSGADFLAIDSRSRHLFGAGYKVIDVDSIRVIGQLPPHSGFGFAIAPEIGRGLGRLGVIFDLHDFKELARVEASGDGSIYDPVTQRAFLLDDTTAIVDVARGSVIKRISLHSPESGVADGSGHVYIALAGIDSILVVDSHTLSAVAAWPAPSCYGARGISIDREHRRLFISCANKRLIVVDPETGRLVAEVETGGWADQIAFDSITHLIFNPNGRGTMTIIREDSPDKYSVAGTVATAEGEKSVVIDEVTHRAFMYHADGENLTLLVLGP